MSIKILAIESSCDETAASIVEDGRRVLSNIISSQAETHKIFGGVVPEVASRKHMEVISYVVDCAIKEAKIEKSDIDAVAVTQGPGLVGAILVGLSYAKAYAYAMKKPLVAVSHIEGHICANYLENEKLSPPFVCLVASGGHSHIVKVLDYDKFEIMGQTRDDAAGEAFDKAARVLGLSYPGGPVIDSLSKKSDKIKISFPKVSFSDDPYDFSFSGVKTSLINFIHKLSQKGIDIAKLGDTDTICTISSDDSSKEKRIFTKEELSGGGVTVFEGIITKADIALSFQSAVIDILLEKLIVCAKKENIKTVCICGGVASNSYLRSTATKMTQNEGLCLNIPKPIFCTDNAAMIGCVAYFEYLKGNFAKLSQNATAYIPLANKLQ